MSTITSNSPLAASPSAKPTSGKANTWAWGTITLLVSALFIMSGGMKLMMSPVVIQSFAQAGIPKAAVLPIGILELTCLALFLIPRTAVLGTFLLTGYLGGAIMSCIVTHISFALPALTGLLIWVAAWLRVEELRALLPLRRGARR